MNNHLQTWFYLWGSPPEAGWGAYSCQDLVVRFQIDVSTTLVAATFRLRHFRSGENRSGYHHGFQWCLGIALLIVTQSFAYPGSSRAPPRPRSPFHMAGIMYLLWGHVVSCMRINRDNGQVFREQSVQVLHLLHIRHSGCC